MHNFGFIRYVPSEKSYGFICKFDSDEDYFFHKSEFKADWKYAVQRIRVRFIIKEVDRESPMAIDVCPVDEDNTPLSIDKLNELLPPPKSSRRVASPYTGTTLDLSKDEIQKALKEISQWKLEAKLDDIKRYFFTISELNNIVTGSASYVIGRKGTGKTALVQHLSDNSGGETLVSKLTFKNFPFNELYAHGNQSFKRPNQYITIWKLIIYSAACRLISSSPKTDAQIKKTIDKAFPPPDSDNLGTIIGKWISGDFSFTVMGTGLNISRWFKEKKTFSLHEKVDNLEQFIKKNSPSIKILILFDELDEDYKEMFENYRKSEYLDLLTSLFKAVQDIRSVFSSTKVHLYPVVFLRDDIYDLIQDADKNKWRDFEVDLEWSDSGIRQLLSHRLSKVLQTTENDFDILWYSIFDKSPIVYSDGKKSIASYNYISMSTHRRPRDYINYLQECANIEMRRSGSKISDQTVREADKSYSNYLKKELIDEIHGLIPDIDKIFSVFSENRKWIQSIDEFRSAYQERVDAGSIIVSDVEMVLRTLFYFSVIGNVVRSDVHIFKLNQPDAQLNFKEKIVVHRGLMKALQII